MIKIKVLTTKLTDNSAVYDVAITQNDARSFIVGCIDKTCANEFACAVHNALKAYSNEHDNLFLAESTDVEDAVRNYAGRMKVNPIDLMDAFNGILNVYKADIAP